MISAISPDGARANFATAEALATWLRSGPHGVTRVFTLTALDGGAAASASAPALPSMSSTPSLVTLPTGGGVVPA